MTVDSFYYSPHIRYINTDMSNLSIKENTFSKIFLLARLGFASVGIFSAGILSYEKLAVVDATCAFGSTGCMQIGSSSFAYIAGVPVAYLGFGAHLSLFLLLILECRRGGTIPRQQIGQLIAGAATLSSVALTWLSLSALHTFCSWCLLSGVCFAGSWFCLALGYTKLQAPTLAPKELAILLSVIAGLAMMALGSIDFYPQRSTKALSVEHLTPEDEAAPYSPWIGSESASVSVMVFGDLTCASCKLGLEILVPEVQKRPGARLIYRHAPNPSHPGAFEAAALGQLANEKDLFWDLAKIFPERAEMSVDDLVETANRLGIGRSEVLAALQPNSKQALEVSQDQQLGSRMGVRSTPTVVVVSSGNQKARELRPEQVAQVLDELLNGN